MLRAASRGWLPAAAAAGVGAALGWHVRAGVYCQEEAPRLLFHDEDDDETVKQIVERRAIEIGSSVRCVTCASQNVEESFTDEASDIRILIRKRLFEGRTEAEIKAELVQLYGESVLYVPQWTLLNIAAGVVPVLTVAGGVLFYLRARRMNVPGTSMTLRHYAADELLPDHVLSHHELTAFRELLAFPRKTKR